MGILKNQSDLRALREAGKITRAVLEALTEHCVPGTSLISMERLANQLLARHRSTAPFKSFNGFNHAICVSLNDEIVNGPPSRERLIQEGDLVSIATAAEYRRIYAKAARSFWVGQTPSEAVQKLLAGSATVIANAIAQSRQAQTLNELLGVVPETAQAFGLTVLQGLGGAGIGKQLHDAPAVPNDPADLEERVLLVPGLCFTLMPMLSLGDTQVKVADDGWTFLTQNGSLAAHVADTLLMGENGLENITGDSLG
ncbi:type I methionyl aminopeptidase [Vampirovibrio sp.]|uniref:type I methionyl aminopeptidase n=1 Tax=Vampirovibrio sp. TaxID=2717857 RepID=UPI0035938355